MIKTNKDLIYPKEKSHNNSWYDANSWIYYSIGKLCLFFRGEIIWEFFSLLKEDSKLYKEKGKKEKKNWESKNLLC